MHRVLVGLDLTSSGTALVAALPGLHALGTREIVVAHVSRMSPAPVLHRTDPTRGVGEALARAGAGLSGTFEVELSMLSGAPATELVNEAEARGVDAIVLGSGTNRGILDGLLGSTVWGVVRRARLPVLLLHPRSERQPEGRPQAPVGASRILHPTDFSDLAVRTLPLVRDLAAGAHLPVTLLHVVEGEPGEGEGRRRAEAARERLVAFAMRLEADGMEGVDVQVSTGIPWERILQAVEAVPGSLIVMATHGRGLVPDVVLGSQSREVARRAQDPLVLIPPAWSERNGGEEASRSRAPTSSRGNDEPTHRDLSHAPGSLGLA